MLQFCNHRTNRIGGGVGDYFGDYLRKDSNSFTIRDTGEIRVNEFRHKLENTNLDFSDQASSANDPNTAYNIFIDISTLAYLIGVSLLKLSKVKL